MSFTRKLDSRIIKDLKKEALYMKMGNDIDKFKVFPAIRDNRVDFYYKGGQLFKYRHGEFSTHIKYAAVIPKDKNDYISESSPLTIDVNFVRDYKRIKENCSKYSGVEDLGVSKLYHKFPYTNNKANTIILDIEVSFESVTKSKKSDRIDILFYNKDERVLRFVEAKHFSNAELWADVGSVPKIKSQITRYEKQIKTMKSKILSAYCEYIKKINSLFKLALPLPIDVDPNVPLLVFGFDRNQQKGRFEDLVLKSAALKGMCYYAIGNVGGTKPDNFWNGIKQFKG